MILTESLELWYEEVYRNLKITKELEIKKVRLFDDSNPRLVKIRKNLPIDFKQKMIELLKK